MLPIGMAASRPTRPAMVMARPVRAAERCTTLTANSVSVVRTSPVPYVLMNVASRYTRRGPGSGNSDGFSLGIPLPHAHGPERTAGRHAGGRPRWLVLCRGGGGSHLHGPSDAYRDVGVHQGHRVLDQAGDAEERVGDDRVHRGGGQHGGDVLVDQADLG